MGCIRETGRRLPVLSPLPAGMIAFSRWIGCSTLSVSGKGGYMSRNSFWKRRILQDQGGVSAEGRYSGRRRGRLGKSVLFEQNARANLRSTGSPQRLFSSVWGRLKQGDGDSTDPPRSFERRPRPVLFVPVLLKTRRDPLR